MEGVRPFPAIRKNHRRHMEDMISIMNIPSVQIVHRTEEVRQRVPRGGGADVVLKKSVRDSVGTLEDLNRKFEDVVNYSW